MSCAFDRFATQVRSKGGKLVHAHATDLLHHVNKRPRERASERLLDEYAGKHRPQSTSSFLGQDELVDEVERAIDIEVERWDLGSACQPLSSAAQQLSKHCTNLDLLDVCMVLLQEVIELDGHGLDVHLVDLRLDLEDSMLSGRPLEFRFSRQR